ncbi:MAG: hypothetical protein HYZ72_12645 [Deltaproteobacteria bacterium]|nr:hypothetical protein [Deltaproteobacteria bacterium]
MYESCGVRFSGVGKSKDTVTAAGNGALGGGPVSATASATCVRGQSCFPAEWRAAPNIWVGFKTKQKVGSVFSIPGSLSSLSDLSLQQALGSNTGKTALQKAALLLLREAVTAILNAAHPNIQYPIEPAASVISQVNTALASGDTATINHLTNTLSTYNKLNRTSEHSDTAVHGAGKSPHPPFAKGGQRGARGDFRTRRCTNLVHFGLGGAAAVCLPPPPC